MATAEQTAAVALYVDRYAAASDQLVDAATTALERIWRSFDGWYDENLLSEIAAQSAELALAQIDRMTGLSDQYIAETVGTLSGQPVHVATTELPPVRGGRNLAGVYRRPGEQYRHKFATSGDQAEALKIADQRRDSLIGSDLRNAGREAQRAQMEAHTITGYRRIIRPELSRTGTCGLCIAASDQVYSTGELMPIHPPSCHCVTMPIVGEEDPGAEVNAEDLARLYREAGSTKAEDLRRTRYAVNHHGELGPLLTRLGDDFKGPGDVKALDQDPERAARLLQDAEPVLADLQQRSSAGEDVSAPLGYQLRLVDRLRSIVG